MRRPTWTVRARTTAAATAVLIPVLAVAGLAGVFVQRDDLTSSVTSLAEQEATALASDLSDELPASPGSEEDVVQFVTLTDGSVASATPEAGDTALLPPPAGTAPTHEIVAGIGGEPDRYVAVAVRADDGLHYVVVARSLESVDAATRSTTGLIVAGGILVLLAVATLTWLSTGRALSPVETMRRRAASISADDLEARLPVPASADEIARLATTLNELLDRIERSAATQRRFVADASHELRSPVATIRALVESDKIAAHPGGHAGLSAEILDETGRLTTLIDDLILLARGDASAPLRRRVVDVTGLLDAELNRARRHRVTGSVAAGLSVWGDAAAVTGAIRNLLDNADRYASDRITVDARADGSQIRIEIADDGPGIPHADRDRVFERFVRLDDSRSRSEGGSGLGLAIVKQTVEDHGGSVHVEAAGPSEAVPGARFVITLPVAADADAHP